MKFTRPLDNILNTEVKVRILRFLCRTGAEWNGTQVAKEIGATPAAAHAALQALEGEGVLALRNMGKTHVYNLHEDNFIAANLLKPLFAKEEKILDAVIGVIKHEIFSSKLKKEIVSVALFGSVHLRQDRPASDIDLLLVIKNAAAREAVERLFEEIGQRTAKEFGNALSPYINTRAEFKAKRRKGVAVINNILKSYRLIYGERPEDLP
jgi:predicted nucleotidyltransferase